MAPTIRPGQLSEEMIDATLADSFPASDPVAVTSTLISGRGH